MPSPTSPIVAPRAAIVRGSSALLVVDMQRYDADAGYGIGLVLHERDPKVAGTYFARVQDVVIPNICRLRELCRELGIPVVYTQSGATRTDGADLSRHRRERFLGTRDGRRSIFRAGEPEYEILPALAPRDEDLVFHKNTVSAFNSSALDRVLRNLGTSTLIVTGVVTDGCVDSTARDGSDLGYETVIVSDACTAWYEEWHDRALDTFARYWGSVANTAEICKRLREEATAQEVR